MKLIYCIALFAGLQIANASAQEKPLSQRMAATVMDIWKDSMVMQPGKKVPWTYDQGVVLEGVESVWKNTGDGKYFRYIQQSMDLFVTDSGGINRYKGEDYTLDNVKNGKSLLLLYKVTGKPKYYRAATLLRDQLKTHPRTASGGFWHKKIYPHQMWLDGLYMAAPFYAEYAATFGEPEDFGDIAHQFILMERVARDKKTGLLYHGWDESKEQQWADKRTGQSPALWGRAMGWYIMGLVDALDYFPKDHPSRDTLLTILRRTAAAIQKVQDPQTGLWYQILDKPGAKGNYLEPSASCIFIYSFAKAVRKGYLPASYLRSAEKGFASIPSHFIEDRGNGEINLKGTVGGTGLGGTPYRDGSYAYYTGEKIVTNDPKGAGTLMLAGCEIEMAALGPGGKGKPVLLDNYYNHESRKDITGRIVPYHYTWEDEANSGFSMLGHIFQKNGASIAMLPKRPTASTLKGASVYVIVDPDTKAETDSPNYMTAEDAAAISKWVAEGGVLVMMENDSANSEFEHFNILPQKFGMRFKENSKNRVTGSQYEMGTFKIPAENPIFPHGPLVYMKEISTLEVAPPAKASFTAGGEVIMAVATVGKGTVFAVGDPWFYNEYADGRKLPDHLQNYRAAEDLVQWLLAQAPAPKGTERKR